MSYLIGIPRLEVRGDVGLLASWFVSRVNCGLFSRILGLIVRWSPRESPGGRFSRIPSSRIVGWVCPGWGAVMFSLEGENRDRR